MKTRQILMVAVLVAAVFAFGGESFARGGGGGGGGGRGAGAGNGQSATQSTTQVRPQGSQRRDGTFLTTGTTANGSTTRQGNGRGVMNGTGVNAAGTTTTAQ